MTDLRSVTLCALLATSCTGVPVTSVSPMALELHTRKRVPIDAALGLTGEYRVVEETVRWDPAKTAIIIVDMWDDHWCKSAAHRVAELAPAIDHVAEVARKHGILVVHCPSTTIEPYEGTKARARAASAPAAEPPVPLSRELRWGTTWCWEQAEREAALPIDDSDMGCDCEDECQIRDAWSMEIATIRIDDRDAVSDNGQEVYNLLTAEGIDNVILMGVHLNMCVLGRPFGIRQMVNLGKNVVLVRDLTDTMYDPKMRPFVDHFTGTDLVVEHVEKYWCPSITSSDLGADAPFRFREDPRNE